MSLFFRRSEQRVMQHWFGVGGDPGGPHRVTPERAKYLAPVFAALRHIVDYGSTLPIDAYRRSDGGQRTKITPPQLISGLDGEGEPGAVTWLGQAFYSLAAYGNAVGWISRLDGNGFPSRVTWLQDCDWSFSETAKQWYVFGAPVPSSRLVHIPWIVPPGKVLGLSPIEHFATVISAGLSAQEYADLRRGGGIPPSVLKNDERVLDTDQAEQVKSRLMSTLRRGEPFVTGKDWTFETVTIPPNHAQFIETLKLSANQTAAIYGIDPTEIGGQSENSMDYSNQEMRQINRAANMRPYIVRIEKAIDRLLPGPQFVKFNTDATIRSDIKTRTEVLGAQIKDGRKSVNEARALEDEPPVDGGDFHNVPSPMSGPVNRNEGVTP
ncbi:phage portal protein [Mycolicibacterium mageritense]|nr:phage portal protein [Mycolicibacterium mageritense]